jgi:hypothetical protein
MSAVTDNWQVIDQQQQQQQLVGLMMMMVRYDEKHHLKIYSPGIIINSTHINRDI